MFNFLNDSISVGFAGIDQNHNTLPHWYALFGSHFVVVVSE